jgi:hypothetical protein
MPQPLKQIAGQRNGRLVAIEYCSNQQKWRCICECGNTTFVKGSSFRRTKSCGCYNRAAVIERNKKHGDAMRGAVAPEYACWHGMVRRCTNPKDAAYPYYGGRGICVCSRWLHGEGALSGYECFLADMGRKPAPDTSIDRIDNELGYSPENCRWASKKQQSRNRRGRRMVNHDGTAMSLAEAADIVGLPRRIIEDRLRLGWPEQDALNTPIMPAFGGKGAARFKRKRMAKS